MWLRKMLLVSIATKLFIANFLFFKKVIYSQLRSPSEFQLSKRCDSVFGSVVLAV